MRQRIILVSFLSILSGCGSIQSNGETRYMNSQNGPGLNIPANYDKQMVGHFYDLPPKPDTYKVSIKPPMS